MKNAVKVVQGASLYVFARLTEAEKGMAQKASKLVKAAARVARPVLWPRKFRLRRFLRLTLFFILGKGLLPPSSRQRMNEQASVCRCGSY
jgi:hypothetical protein